MTSELPRLVVATSNAGKVKELAALLAGRARVETLKDHPGVEMPPEDGETFEANARIKAEFLSRHLGCVALADDSGLEVDALGGAPGVRSARYASGTDADRSAKLLIELGDRVDRTCRFVSAIALAEPGRDTVTVRGTVEGVIGPTGKGTGGFGYDPIFWLADGRSMAELSVEEKNQISHRGRALRLILPAVESAIFRLAR